MAKIFVIDDEPILLDLISAALRLDGHIVSTTADPLAASAAILAEHPDVLITEANMAPISGFQLVKDLHSEGVECPALIMSGNHGISTIALVTFGHQAVLEKPFTAAELRLAFQKMLALKRCGLSGLPARKGMPGS